MNPELTAYLIGMAVGAAIVNVTWYLTLKFHSQKFRLNRPKGSLRSVVPGNFSGADSGWSSRG